MEIQTGRRRQIRLEFDKDIYKNFTLIGEDVKGAKPLDVSHFGIGLYYEIGSTSLVMGQQIEFILKFDSVEIEVVGIVRHASAKMLGIEFLKIGKNKDQFYNYLDSKIVKKFNIPSDLSLRGLLVSKVDVKMTALIMFFEAVFFILLFVLYLIFSASATEDAPKKYLEGLNQQQEIRVV